MWNAGLDETQTEIKIVRRNINNLRYTNDTTLTAESEEELKSLLMRVKEESEKAGLKLSILANRRGKRGSSDKNPVGGACSHDIKRCLLFGKKTMTNLDSILKGRDMILLTKVHIVKAMVFPVIMYECESWTIMKVECRRIDAFKLWCWRRLLRVPWTARSSNQSILKNQPWRFTGRTDAEDEAPILWPPDAKSRLIGKDPDAGKDWGQEKGVTEDEMVGWYHWLNGHEFEQSLGDG